MDLDNSVRNNEREIVSQWMCIHCGGSNLTEKLFNQQRNVKGYNKPPFNPCNSNNKRNEHSSPKPNTCFIFGSEDHSIANCPKPDTLENLAEN